MRHLILTAAIIVGFVLATAPAQAVDPPPPDPSAKVSGACHYDGAGAEDDARVAFSYPPLRREADLPDRQRVEEGATACGQAAANGDTPDGGSYMAVEVHVFDGEFRYSTVPATDAATQATEEAPAGPATPSLQVSAEGACHYDGDGGQDSAGVGTAEVDAPDQQATSSGLEACADAASNGDRPDGGSYLAVTVEAGDEEVTVSTVPASEATSGVLP